MVLAVKDLLDMKQLPEMTLICGEEGLNNIINDIHIVEVDCMEFFLTSGAFLLTSFEAYRNCTISQYEEHLKEIFKHKLAAFVVKENNQLKQYEIRLQMLKKYCDKYDVALFNIKNDVSYWPIINTIMTLIFEKENAQLRYNKLMNDNFNSYVFNYDNVKHSEIILLLQRIIGNPISLYYKNLNCYASTKKCPEDMVIYDNLTDYQPKFISKYHYKVQNNGKYNQYIVKVKLLNEIDFYISIDEENKKMNDLDFIAIENGIVTLQYCSVIQNMKEHTNKKYHHDIIYNMISGNLTYDETTEAARLLNLKNNQYYRIVSFHLGKKDNKGNYLKDRLKKIEEAETVISTFYPDEHIYRNLDQMIMLQEMSSKTETQNELNQVVKLLSILRNENTDDEEIDFRVGLGNIVKGYRDLGESYKQSVKSIKYVKSLRKITGDNKKSIVHYSKIGFFQMFLDIDDYHQLKKYIPESVINIYKYDQQHNSDLMNTLETYLRKNFSLKKAAEELCIQYRSASYRLEKIKGIGNIDFDDPVEVLAVKNGIVILELIKAMNDNKSEFL